MEVDPGLMSIIDVETYRGFVIRTEDSLERGVPYRAVVHRIGNRGDKLFGIQGANVELVAANVRAHIDKLLERR